MKPSLPPENSGRFCLFVQALAIGAGILAFAGSIFIIGSVFM